MAYRIELRPSARKALDAIDKKSFLRIRKAIDALAENPRPHAAIRLKGHPFYRVRAGDYRIVYDIQDDVLLVLVVRIGHRREVYEGV